MEQRHPLLLLDSGSSATTGRLGEVLAAIETLPGVPGEIATWLTSSGEGLGAFILLSLAFVAAGHLCVWLVGRFWRVADGSRAAVARHLVQAIAFLLGGGIVLLLTHGYAGPPRQAAMALYLAWFLTYTLAGTAWRLLQTALPADSQILAAEEARRLRRSLWLSSAFAFGALAFGLVLQLAAVLLDTRLLLGGLLLLIVAGLLFVLLRRLRRAQLKRRAMLGAVKLDDGLMRLVVHGWYGFHLVFLLAVVVATLGAALHLGEDPFLRGLGSLLLFAALPLALGLVGWLAPPEAVEEGEHRHLWRLLLVRCLRLLLVIGAWYGLARIWSLDLLDLASDNLGERAVEALFNIAIVVLLAYLVWEVIRTVLDTHVAGKPAAVHADTDGDAAAHGPQTASRLQTFAPLLRKFLFFCVVVLVIMVSLSSIGVEIGPLLAGAGVVGIALGFGAQTLVHDIVSGIFYLLDDSFRIGEYVEAGETRGTVEGMSIRSLRLRHQQGMVHTLPFGEIKQLTNYSRDWAIIKLQFQLSFDTDVEKVRKLIKKVNAELQADPTYGPTMLAPLKSQGVRGTTPIGLIVGVKFTAKPGTQFPLRKEVYRRVRDSFIANNIQFARPNVLVHTAPASADGAPELDKPTAAAAAKTALDHMEEKTS